MIKLKNGLNHILKQSLGLDFKLLWSCWSLEQIVNEGHVSFSKHNVLIIARTFGNFPFVLPKIQRRSAPCFIWKQFSICACKQNEIGFWFS